MADLLEQGAAWLQEQRIRHLSRTVTYLRAGDSVDLPTTIGSTTFEQADAYGVIHRTERRDYLIPAADTVLGGYGNALIEGREGDDFLKGDPGNDWLLGGEGNDSLTGDADNDMLRGENGNDVLFGDNEIGRAHV